MSQSNYPTTGQGRRPVPPNTTNNNGARPIPSSANDTTRTSPSPTRDNSGMLRNRSNTGGSPTSNFGKPERPVRPTGAAPLMDSKKEQPTENNKKLLNSSGGIANDNFKAPPNKEPPRKSPTDSQNSSGDKSSTASNHSQASLRRKGKANMSDKAPLPMEFLKDPNGKISITEANMDPTGKEKWYTITFEYTMVLPSSEWSKPDKEGELLKPGSVMKKNWKARYCILQGSKFFCFKVKPQSKDDEPSISVELHSGSVVDTGINGKYYCFDLVEQDGIKRANLAAKNKQEYDLWVEKLQAATTYEGPVVQIVEQMKQSIAVQYSPEYGYVGFPIEWKQFLRDNGITEKEFFEKIEQTLTNLKFHKTSTPLVSHPVSNLPGAIEDVVNKKGSPDMYTGFQLLGSGSFGEVYEAIHIETNQRVAIKKMLVTPRRLKLFISEINIQRSTQHPNVVKLLDAFPVDTHIWVVLEYMANGNLTMILDVLKETKQSMTEPQIAYVLMETLKSLSYIHSLHRIHRDIKSDNVLLGGSGEIKLADFGYAVQLSGEDEKRQTVCGSPYWMAPEVIMGQQYGKEVDIWSLGIMLMECCDLEPPYILESPSKALVLLSTKPVPPLRNPEKWSSELRNFRDLCLNRDPKARPEAIELLQHPFLRRTCTATQFKDTLLDRQKKKKDACSIQ